MELKPALAQMEKEFDKPSLQNLVNIWKIVQKPSESVLEFLGRLKEAAAALTRNKADYPVMSKAAAAAKALDESQYIEDEDWKKQEEAIPVLRETFIFPHFLRGLREDLRQVVINAKPRTLTKAVAVAQEHEAYATSLGELAMVNLTINDGPANDATVDRAAQQLQQLNNKGSQSQGRDKRTIRDRADNRRPPGPLKTLPRSSPRRYSPYQHPPYFDVQAYGVIDQQAPARQTPRPRRQATQDDRCHFCARPGHFQAECRTKQRYLATVDVSFPPSMQRGMPDLRWEGPGLSRGSRGSPAVPSKPFGSLRDSTWMRRMDGIPPKNGQRPPRMGGPVIPPPMRSVSHLMRQ
jgi:hypothetical protein